MGLKSQHISIYGFGSYFRDAPEWNDIDVLIVHNDLTPNSINLALQAKGKLKLSIEEIDISILSIAEENRLGFIENAKALFLARYVGSDVNSANFVQQVEKVIFRQVLP